MTPGHPRWMLLPICAAHDARGIPGIPRGEAIKMLLLLESHNAKSIFSVFDLLTLFSGSEVSVRWWFRADNERQPQVQRDDATITSWHWLFVSCHTLHMSPSMSLLACSASSSAAAVVAAEKNFLVKPSAGQVQICCWTHSWTPPTTTFIE